MDNPAISFHQGFAGTAGQRRGAGTGDRLPLVVYRLYPADGREEIVRGMRVIGLNTRSLRNISGIGSDYFVYNYMQSQVDGFSGTALGAFGSAQTGIPASIVAPSLFFEEVEVRGSRASGSGCGGGQLQR
jgi:hypothetical protein